MLAKAVQKANLLTAISSLQSKPYPCPIPHDKAIEALQMFTDSHIIITKVIASPNFYRMLGAYSVDQIKLYEEAMFQKVETFCKEKENEQKVQNLVEMVQKGLRYEIQALKTLELEFSLFKKTLQPSAQIEEVPYAGINDTPYVELG
tara:strand:- start:53 stop:493 length:441 start_codon:yes stop_codon:yes gene_type:complete